MDDLKVFKFIPADFMVQFLAIKWLGLGCTILVTTFVLLEKLMITEHPAVPYLKETGFKLGIQSAVGPIVMCFTLYPLLCFPHWALCIINGMFCVFLCVVGYTMHLNTLDYQPYYFFSIMFYILSPLTLVTMIWLGVVIAKHKKEQPLPPDQVPADGAPVTTDQTATPGTSTPTIEGGNTPATASSDAGTPAKSTGTNTPAKSTETGSTPVKSEPAKSTNTKTK